MKFALMSTFSLAAAAIAAPVSGVDDSLQKQIQRTEVQIINVTNDIVQSNANLKTDYNNGAKMIGQLVNGLQGPQPCSPFVPGRPTTKDGAVQSLQKANLALQSLSLHLLDPANKVAEGDFHADVCQASAYYSAISKFVGV